MEFQLKKAAPAIVIISSLFLLAYIVNYALGIMEVATDHSLRPDQRAGEVWRIWVVLPSLVTIVLGLVYFRTQGHDRWVVFLYLGLLIMSLVLMGLLLASPDPALTEKMMRGVFLPATAGTSVFLVYRFFAKR